MRCLIDCCPRRPTASRRTRATSSRGSTVSSGSRWDPCRRIRRRSSSIEAPPRDPHLLLLSIKNEALARAWFTNVITRVRRHGRRRDVRGIDLTVFTDVKVAAARAAFAVVDGKVAIVGDIASVKAAIDTNGSSALAASDDFEAATGGAHRRSLGSCSSSCAASWTPRSQWPGHRVRAAHQRLADGLVPEWAAFRLRVEGDALEMDSAMPHVDAAPGPDDNDANGVAAFAPPSTIALAAATTTERRSPSQVALYRRDPSMAEAFTGDRSGGRDPRRSRGERRLDG